MSKLLDQIAAESLKKGFNPVVGTAYEKTEEWLSWFRGSVNDFHYFKRNINGRVKQYEMLTLNMAKKAAEDWASLLWNDHCSISVDNPVAQERLDEVLYNNNFYVDAGNLIEKAFALGNGFMIEYIANGQTKIDFITLRNALVTDYDNTRVTGLVTINKFSLPDGQHVTHLTYHYMRDGLYYIEHEVFTSKHKDSIGKFRPENLLLVFSEEEVNAMRKSFDGQIRYIHIYDSGMPFFQHIRPNITNNFDIESPLGISIFANHIDMLKSMDTKFNATEREVVQNKTRIMLNSEWLKVKAEDNEQTGQMQFIRYYDENDDAIMGIPTQDSDKLIEFYQGEFRLEPLEMSLSNDLQRYGSAIGLGKQYYNLRNVRGDNYQSEKAILNSNSQTWKNKVKHELIIGEAMTNMAYSVLFLESILGNINVDPNSLEINVKFDDSLVQDDDATLEKMLKLANGGFIPRWMVLMHEFNMSEEEAKELLKEAAGLELEALPEVQEVVTPEEIDEEEVEEAELEEERS